MFPGESEGGGFGLKVAVWTDLPRSGKGRGELIFEGTGLRVVMWPSFSLEILCCAWRPAVYVCMSEGGSLVLWSGRRVACSSPKKHVLYISY